MKLSELKKVVKSAVKEAIQEEMKDILLEAVKSPTQPITSTPTKTEPLQETDRLKLRENMMNVLDSMRPGADGTINATTADVPMAVGGTVDTTSPNGALPQGNVSMDQIMGLMNSK
tara:strand:+ start:106 stop:453 length:348 start_codon:yes stop_codon:yes gene_type:complete